MIYWQLFWSFFQIGLFSIGGGYAAMPLIQHQVVEVHPWLTMAQFSDIITISQMTPGPISINSATFVGLQVAGIPGAVIATIGNVLPSCIIVLSLAFAYYRYRKLRLIKGVLLQLRAAVVAMIAFAGLSIMFLSFWHSDGLPEHFDETDYIAVGIFAVSLLLMRRFKRLDPILIMIVAGVAGIILYSVF